MNKPLMLDLFCGAGGASMGYHNLGFEVVGIDNMPQSRYPFTFIKGDVFEILNSGLINLGKFDAIHASPPCNHYSVSNNIWDKDHPDLIAKTREHLLTLNCPYIIENVISAPLINPSLVCGLSLGLNVRRHRIFETSFPCESTICPKGHPGDWLLVFGNACMTRGKSVGKAKGGGNKIKRETRSVKEARLAMGIDWMIMKELSQAIPPKYTEHIGEYLLRVI